MVLSLPLVLAVSADSGVGTSGEDGGRTRIKRSIEMLIGSEEVECRLLDDSGESISATPEAGRDGGGITNELCIEFCEGFVLWLPHDGCNRIVHEACKEVLLGGC